MKPILYILVGVALFIVLSLVVQLLGLVSLVFMFFGWALHHWILVLFFTLIAYLALWGK